MPYAIRKSGNKWAVYKKDGGKVVGHTTSRAKAIKMIAAIHANIGSK